MYYLCIVLQRLFGLPFTVYGLLFIKLSTLSTVSKH